MRFLASLGYRKKVYVLFLPVFLLFTVGLAGVYALASRSLRLEHRQHLSGTSQLTRNSVALSEKELRNMVSLFQANRTLKEYLYITAILGGDTAPLRELLRPMHAVLGVDFIGVHDREGTLIVLLDAKDERTESRSVTDIVGDLPARVTSGFHDYRGAEQQVALGPLTDDQGATIGFLTVGRYLDTDRLRDLSAISDTEIMIVEGDLVEHGTLDNLGQPYAPRHGSLEVAGRSFAVEEQLISGIDGSEIGLLVVALSDDDFHRDMGRLRTLIFLLLGAAVVASLTLAKLFVRALCDPLDRIVGFIGKVARGEFDEELTVEGRDEIAELARRFTGMQRQLKAHRELMTQYADRLEGAIQERTAELKKVQSQLYQSQKMEAIGEVAGGLAHDFNNILTAILGYSEMLQLEIEADDPRRKHADVIQRAVERAAHLTHGLLAFSRTQVMHPAAVDLNEVVTRSQELFTRLIRSDIEVRTRLLGRELPVMADAGQLEQVLLNLVVNARDAMPQGGVLTVETGLAPLDRDFFDPGELRGEELFATVRVSDTGRGMDERTLEQIFQPFFTTKAPGKGTGLGLAIVFGIVKQHNGHVRVDSAVGRGTTFWVSLPLIGERITRKAAAKGSAPGAGNETILVAEDDDFIRSYLHEILEKHGYRVLSASTGEEALATFAAHVEEVRLLLLDVIMPGKHGMKVFREARRLRPDIRAVFLSGYTADILRGTDLGEEKINFISKPVLLNDLLQKVREVLDEPPEGQGATA